MSNAFVDKNAPLILVVDDERSMRILLRHAMEKEGYQVVEAKNGEECLAVYERLQPDMILLDAIMPVMDGFTCCSQLQKLFEREATGVSPAGSVAMPSERTPVLMITGLDDEASVDRAFLVGAIDYVTKPIHWAVLRQRVRRLIQQSQLYKALQRSEQRLRHSAFHDPLTDLPNRALFMDRLEQAVQQAKRHSDYVLAVLFLDLDRFKIINDSLGHMIGDQLLIAIARRLEKCRRGGDTIARFGGDEFAILLNDIVDVNYATSIAERVKQELALPFNLNGHQVFTSASIGIVLGSVADGGFDDLLRAADIAMYRAKALGGARYQAFNAAMNEQALTRLQLEIDLRQAIERQEFRVHYQPIVLLTTGKVIGFEALLRWEHPVRGLIYPTEFIPTAEETGLIVPIGQWVLREACHQMRVWQVRFTTSSPLTISVNCSVKQLTQAELIEQVAQILHETNLDASSLRLEITESVLLENVESLTVVLSQLRALGVSLYLDDFGTGHSSLSYLHRLPINTLKIDRSFINRIGGSDESSEIVRAITTLAQALGLDVIAEGVETPAQLAQLSGLPCKYAQGYFFSKPLDSATAGVLIAQKLGGTNNNLVLPL